MLTFMHDIFAMGIHQLLYLLEDFVTHPQRLLTILFDGVAYGMLLFVLACGLSVTLGLMNFVNLAHGSFAMAGGYITVIVVNRFGVPFAGGLVLAFLLTAAIGVVLERTLY